MLPTLKKVHSAVTIVLFAVALVMLLSRYSAKNLQLDAVLLSGASREKPQNNSQQAEQTLPEQTCLLCRAAHLIKSKINKNQSIHREKTPRHYKICYLSRNSFSPRKRSPKCHPPPTQSTCSPVPVAVPLATPWAVPVAMPVAVPLAMPWAVLVAVPLAMAACCTLLAGWRCRLLALGLCSPLPVFCRVTPAACRCVLEGKKNTGGETHQGPHKENAAPAFPQHSHQPPPEMAGTQT